MFYKILGHFRTSWDIVKTSPDILRHRGRKTHFAIQLKSGKLILSGSDATNNSIVFFGTVSTVWRIKLSLLITIAMFNAAPYSPMFKFLSTFEGVADSFKGSEANVRRDFE